MNSALYVKEECDVDMMKYTSLPLGLVSDDLFNPVWVAGEGFSEMSYAPGEYLNNKDAPYDCYVDPQATAGAPSNDFMDWTGNTLSLMNSPITGAPSEASFTDFLSPSAISNTPPSWATDAFDPQGAYTFGDDASPEASVASDTRAPISMKQQQQQQQPTSPVLHSTTKSKVSKRKGKNASTSVSTSSKPLLRSDIKSKSVSSACSTASSSSSGSSSPSMASHGRFSSSGHGGNHNITLRTASRKPKPMPTSNRFENTSTHSRESSPSSPDAGGESLTSEERRARQNHNVVEKQYRNRLNIQFERLLAILPANQVAADGEGRGGGSSGTTSTGRHRDFDERRMSKAEVLDMARRRIHSLEEERKQLHAEREALLKNVNIMQSAIQQQQQQ